MGEMNVFGLPVVEESVSAVTLTPSIQLGTRRIHNGEEYVYMYNSGGGTISVGNGVKPITAASGYSVAATSLTDVFSPCFGVVKHVAMATLEYGWVMTRGFTTVVVVSDTTGNFVPLALSTAGKFRSVSLTANTDIAFGGTGLVDAGFALNANTAAGGSVYAFIKANC